MNKVVWFEIPLTNQNVRKSSTKMFLNGILVPLQTTITMQQ